MENLSEKEKLSVMEFKKRLLENFGSLILDILLFGSKTKGKAKKTSDIDILVIIRNERHDLKRKVLNIAFDVMLEFSINLSVVVISKSSWQKYSNLPTSFSFNVQKDAIKL